MNCIAVELCFTYLWDAFIKYFFWFLSTEKPEILQDPSDVEVVFGANAVFKCAVEGDPIPEIKWMLNSNEIHSDSSERIHISSNGETLAIDRIDARDQGVLMEKSIKIYITECMHEPHSCLPILFSIFIN
jgi:hypothetical protein